MRFFSKGHGPFEVVNFVQRAAVLTFLNPGKELAGTGAVVFLLFFDFLTFESVCFEDMHCFKRMIRVDLLTYSSTKLKIAINTSK